MPQRRRMTRAAGAAAALLFLLAAGAAPATGSPGVGLGPRPMAALAPIEGDGQAEPRIVGGTEVDPPGKYPFMVALVHSGGDAYRDQFCGGSLIGPEWVLTAAHCAIGEIAVDLVIGRHNLDSGQGERIASASIIIHPSYDPDTSRNDIALIRLSTPSAYAPVVLPGDTALEAAGTLLTVIGWGDTHSTPQWPQRLREAQVPVVGAAACREAYRGETEPPTAVDMCAGNLAFGGVDSCQGDSGGPLFGSTPAGFVQVGIVSRGTGCALAGYPGIYARVYPFTAWITGQTGILPAPAPVTCAGARATLVGTEGPDALTGTAGDDVIAGLDGDDTIDGLGGNDLICGGSGLDTVTGGGGSDRLYGEAGDDNLDGAAGVDVVVGGLGTDTCWGETTYGCELPEQSAGVLCMGVVPTIVGTAGADTINGTAGADVITGLGGDDTIAGLGGNDLICGNEGADNLLGGPGLDRLQGGLGDDTVTGGDGADVLRGGPGADRLRGDAGNDRLLGENGNDLLDGGAGLDHLAGGPGTDTCHGEDVNGCELPAVTRFDSGPRHLAIPDDSAAGVSDEITVTGAGLVIDLDVDLAISHTWVGDLIVRLTHVDTGTSVILINRPGSPAISSVGCSGDDIEAILDDEASPAAETTCRPVAPALSGRLAPFGALSAFDGEAMAGTWRLLVLDRSLVDRGFLESWALVFQG